MFIDARCAAHNNMKSHADGTITFGARFFASSSKIKLLNARSSTDAEVISTADFRLKVLHITLPLEA